MQIFPKIVFIFFPQLTKNIKTCKKGLNKFRLRRAPLHYKKLHLGKEKKKVGGGGDKKKEFQI